MYLLLFWVGELMIGEFDVEFYGCGVGMCQEYRD
jgi:hypothetical protein